VALKTGEVTGMNVSPQNIHTMKKTDPEEYEPYEVEEITRMIGDEEVEVDINDI